MGSESPSSVKTKITASLDPKLVKAIDGYLNETKIRSRSQLIEKILRQWYEAQKKRKLEKKVEQYYLSLSIEESEEDRKWSKIAAKSAKHLWED